MLNLIIVVLGLCMSTTLGTLNLDITHWQWWAIIGICLGCLMIGELDS